MIRVEKSALHQSAFRLDSEPLTHNHQLSNGHALLRRQPRHPPALSQGRAVDLVYLDPPFNSAQNYNAFFHEKDGTDAASQIHAFEDTWHWDIETKKAYDAVTEQPGKVSDVMQAFYTFLGGNDMMAYLTMMSSRFVELRRVLKPTGSLYLHCDPTASHYLKLLCDAVFGAENFVNEICWRRYGVHNDVGQGSTHYGRVHDILLFYGKTTDRTWNQIFTPLDKEYVEETYRHIEEKTGRRFTDSHDRAEAQKKEIQSLNGKAILAHGDTAKKRLRNSIKKKSSTIRKTGYARQKLYLDESKGVPVQEWWADVKALTGSNAERLGYPTQKPVALLERIIQASSNPGDVVLDRSAAAARRLTPPKNSAATGSA